MALDEFGHYEGKFVAGNRQHDEHGDQLPAGFEQGKPGAGGFLCAPVGFGLIKVWPV